MSIRLGYVIGYVENVEATLELYKQAFGLDGALLTHDYGELKTGATTLSFAELSLAKANFENPVPDVSFEDPVLRTSTETSPPPIEIAFIADDVQATYEAAIAAGFSAYVDPIEKPWGQTVAWLRDPNGFLVEIGSPMQH